MKKSKFLAVIMVFAVLLTSCNWLGSSIDASIIENAVKINLNDSKVKVDGNLANSDTSNAVYVANDIIYYESGKDFTYGEGNEQDAHSSEEAMIHTVVHITEPGNYILSGKLSRGQIAVDLGEDAEGDPTKVVTLILNGVDITCEVAPAVIFYNVYECSPADTESASKDVDTSSAGANVIIADDTVNTINGSYVARIYKPDSVVLNESKTEVEDAKKLHKYDGAFYSKMSMNIDGAKEGTGILNINAKNEGLDSELHLTINGGNVNINSGNDGINTNEDGVSVTTVNGGNLAINVNGATGEGDGIDSNGWLVINGGKVVASACATSGDAGIDSDMGIHINGGVVIAGGNMLDQIEDGGQNYAVFNFAQRQNGGSPIALKDENGNSLLDTALENDYSILIYSAPDLTSGTYSLLSGDTQLSGIAGNFAHVRHPGFNPPTEFENDERPEPPQMPEGFEDGERPEMPKDFGPSKRPERPEDFDGKEPPQMPTDFHSNINFDIGELSPEFKIADGGNMFIGITELQ